MCLITTRLGSWFLRTTTRICCGSLLVLILRLTLSSFVPLDFGKQSERLLGLFFIGRKGVVELPFFLQMKLLVSLFSTELDAQKDCSLIEKTEDEEEDAIVYKGNPCGVVAT